MGNLLTLPQSRFVAEYVKEGSPNATECAIRAGYKPLRAKESASRLLRKAPVVEAIQRLQAARVVRAERTAEAILADLIQLQADAHGAEQFAAAIRAAELQGKFLGMFDDRLKVSGTITHKVEYVNDWRGPGGGSDVVDAEVSEVIGGLVAESEE
jgi:hypothetical protein